MLCGKGEGQARDLKFINKVNKKIKLENKIKIFSSLIFLFNFY